MDASVGEFVEGIDCRLNVGELIPEGEFIVSGKRCRTESRNEDSLRLDLRIGDDTVRPLYQGRPETAFEKCLSDAIRIEFRRLPHPEIDIFLSRIGLDADFKQLSLFSTDNLHHLSAYRGCEKNVLSHLVCHYRCACKDFFAFLNEKFGNETAEIRRFDGDNVRSNHLPGVQGRFSFYGNIQTLFQIDVV